MSVRSRTGVLGKGTPRVPPPGGTSLPVGECNGQVLFWNEDTQSYLLTACPDDGDIYVYDDATGLVVPQPPAVVQPYGFGSNQINASSPSFLHPWYDNGNSVPNPNGLLLAGQLTAVRTGTLRRMFVRHSNPSGATNYTYTVLVNGVATALAVTLSSASMLGSNLATDVAVTEGDAIGLQVTHAGASLGVRTTVQFELAA